MTIHEAMEQGIEVVRCDPWNPYARLELPLFWRDEDGNINTEGRGKPQYSVVAHMIDPPSNLALGRAAEYKTGMVMLPRPLGLLDPDEEGWEEWKRPDDYDAKFPKEVK